jgi:hypothetical protein
MMNSGNFDDVADYQSALGGLKPAPPKRVLVGRAKFTSPAEILPAYTSGGLLAIIGS